jgi:NAD(P)-dependent dehydrogenase (short-subunit alcohol dehydrogenase family)
MSRAGQVVVVTGGANGIGKAMCEKFAAEGASVVVVDMNIAAAQAVADACDGVALSANCSVEMDLRRVISQTEYQVGPIDVFCANAGIPSNGGIDVPNDEWDRIWKVNQMQHVWVARHLFPR